ncbi:MAG: TonB-dependent receptor [Myxococcales bacterium]|nr:TonB-dependent receptor [Myxococcales bacterium]
MCCCLPGGALADPPGMATEDEPIRPDVPPRLLQQAVPSYPEEASQSRLHGDVTVLVDIDHTGEVVASRFESGEEIFRAAALQAASLLRFEPAQRSGAPVAATTRVRFHFAPPGDDVSDDFVEEVVVHGSPDLEDTHARTTLDSADLERSAGDDFAETLTQVPGVTHAPGLADASKPIIRGQPERRLLVLYDGVRHESQKWGPDHGTEIDPFSAGSISVVRGAAGARYGPDAIGGVILVAPPPLRQEPGVGGTALAGFASNGQRPHGAMRLDAAPEAVPGLSLRVEGNVAIGATQRTPTYLLGNTASRTWNLGAATTYQWQSGQISASWHHHDFRAGVFYGVRNSTPSDFEAQLALDVPATADLWTVTYDIDRPMQAVSHDVAILKADLFGKLGSLEATYALQVNLRQELEQVRDSVTGPQFDFTLRTHSVDVLYHHPTVTPPFGQLEGGVGLQGSFQENVYRGLSLIPSYRSFSGGAFAYERLSLARVDLEVGARIDALTRAAFLRERDYEAHARRDVLSPADCTEGPTSVRCPASYDTGSVSVGGLVHLVPEHLDVKVDLSTASRFPNVDELYLLGSAPTFPVFANGSPSLRVETAWGGSLTTGLRLGALEAEVSAYGQLVDDYIYFAPRLNDSGEPRFDVTIRGTWPSYGYRAVQALFYGVDGSLQLGPTAPVGLNVRGSLVRATERPSGAFLIGTPADRLHLALIGRPRTVGPLRDVEIRLTSDLVATQSRVDEGVDFASAPPGYALMGASIEARIPGDRPIRVGVTARNLLDTPYREYTSLLRYYADQPGRDVRLRLGMDF